MCPSICVSVCAHTCMIQAIQNSDDATIELRLQAIRTTGLLGAVDENVYHAHLRKSGGVIDAFSSQSDHLEDEAEEETASSSINEGEKSMTKIEKYYFTVVIRELMNILRDSNLSSHHQAASAIAIRVFRILGSQAQSSLNTLLEGIVFRLYLTEPGNNLRDALLDHLITLIHVMGRIIRKYQPTLVALVCKFLDSHLQPCLDIIESMCIVLHVQDFNNVLRDVTPSLLQVKYITTFYLMPNFVHTHIFTLKFYQLIRSLLFILIFYFYSCALQASPSLIVLRETASHLPPISLCFRIKLFCLCPCWLTA